MKVFAERVEGRFVLYIVCVFMYLTSNMVIILSCNVFAEKVEGRLDLYIVYRICRSISRSYSTYSCCLYQGCVLYSECFEFCVV